jgi:hypothetical protein
MFKLPGAENQAKLIAAYDQLAKDQKKVCHRVDPLRKYVTPSSWF